MGNETSSVKINSLLTAEDIKRLRAGFPVRIYLVTTAIRMNTENSDEIYFSSTK